MSVSRPRADVQMVMSASTLLGPTAVRLSVELASGGHPMEEVARVGHSADKMCTVGWQEDIWKFYDF